MKKKNLKKLLVGSPLFLSGASFFHRGQARVFLYHRFGGPIRHNPTVIDSGTFEWQLQQIRKHCTTITLNEYAMAVARKNPLPDNAVVLTVDDGYRDFYDLAYPLIMKYGMSATFFVTVNFLENKIWLWPDMLMYILNNTKERQGAFNYRGKTFLLNVNDEISLFQSWSAMSDYCIQLGDKDKWSLIEMLSEETGVSLPRHPPVEFSPVTWDMVREMSDNGIEIGSHTMNHPILSKIDPKFLEDEVRGSKHSIAEKIGKEVSSFCYPNGNPDDITELVIDEVRKSGYRAAVMGVKDAGERDRYRIPRIGVNTDRDDFLWKMCGMEIALSNRKSSP